MEIRDIEIFLTLAEELHFGRTATRLHVTPARVSQAIKQQERRVGAELFERNSRNVRLTPIGEQLRDDLIPVYRGLKDSVERARMAAKGVTATLRIGLLPLNGYELKPCWEELRHANYVDAFGLCAAASSTSSLPGSRSMSPTSPSDRPRTANARC